VIVFITMFFLQRVAARATVPIATKLSTRAFGSGIQRIGTDVSPLMSKVVIHNDVVYLSGLIDNSGTASNVTGQTKNVLREVDELLEKAGTSKSNVLSASIWLKDIDADFHGMNAVWKDWIDPENKPVRATVQSPMARPEILVEIQVTAAK
jgi:enamine deaminase RidA (YjgF/YER057c/UK114 family)